MVPFTITTSNSTSEPPSSSSAVPEALPSLVSTPTALRTGTPPISPWTCSVNRTVWTPAMTREASRRRPGAAGSAVLVSFECEHAGSRATATHAVVSTPRPVLLRPIPGCYPCGPVGPPRRRLRAESLVQEQQSDPGQDARKDQADRPSRAAGQPGGSAAAHEHHGRVA